jgi:hypothetical protein
MNDVAALSRAGSAAPNATTARALDHFVIATQDLETASEIYRRLGFRVLPVMEHAEIGTSNIIVQFLGTYLEIIGDFAQARVAGMAEKARPWLALGDVYWMTSMTSDALEPERAAMLAAGLDLEPILSARRRVRLPTGGWTETDSRSMYLYNKDRVHMSLFVSDHRRPEAIWIEDYQRHPNLALRVQAMRYVAHAPLDDVAYFTAVSGGDPVVATEDQVTFRTPRGETLEIVSPRRLAEILPEAAPLQPEIGGRGASLTVTVRSLEHCAWTLRDGGVPFTRRGDRIAVGSAHGAGMAFEFLQAEPD